MTARINRVLIAFGTPVKREWILRLAGETREDDKEQRIPMCEENRLQMWFALADGYTLVNENEFDTASPDNAGVRGTE